MALAAKVPLKTRKQAEMAKKQTVKSKSKLARRDIRRPQDTNETQKDIERALSNTQGASGLKGILGLKRDSIVVAEKVFQWRRLDADVANREEHILGMANVVADSGRPLDPLLVLQVGDRFYVIDGHHRLASYDTARWTGDIPAKVFGGTLAQAYLEALRLNSRNKLPMTKENKQEAAWKLVRLQDGSSREQISEWTTVSTSNVSNMRRVLKKLQELERGADAIPIDELTWRRALREDWATEDGGKEWDADEWKEREANEIVEALMKANIGFTLKKQPEITAMALEKLDPSLPEALMKEWVYRLDPEFLVGFIKDQLDEGAATAWTALQQPVKF
jgi:hypothetical protein